MLSNEKVLKCALFALACFVCVSGEYVHYVDCGSTARVVWVQVEPCDDEYNCTLYHGTSTNVSIRFIPRNVITNLTVVAYVRLGRSRPLTIPLGSGCEKNGLTCYRKYGEAVIYSSVFEIKRSFPRMGVNVRFVLYDQKGDRLVCVIMIGHIDERISLSELDAFLRSRDKRRRSALYL